MAASDPTAAAQPAVNPDLQAVHTELIALASELDSAVGRAQTAAEVTAILNELSAVSARVNDVGRQLFVQQTNDIHDLSQQVISATGQAKQAAQQLDDIKSFIGDITSFLALVDKLVGVAKLVA